MQALNLAANAGDGAENGAENNQDLLKGL